MVSFSQPGSKCLVQIGQGAGGSGGKKVGAHGSEESLYFPFFM
jgi:hypothetical protein